MPSLPNLSNTLTPYLATSPPPLPSPLNTPPSSPPYPLIPHPPSKPSHTHPQTTPTTPTLSTAYPPVPHSPIPLPDHLSSSRILYTNNLHTSPSNYTSTIWHLPIPSILHLSTPPSSLSPPLPLKISPRPTSSLLPSVPSQSPNSSPQRPSQTYSTPIAHTETEQYVVDAAHPTKLQHLSDTTLLRRIFMERLGNRRRNACNNQAERCGGGRRIW